AISHAGHSPLQFYPDGSNQYVVLRGNVFHATWGRPLELFAARDVLIENNIVTHAYHGGQSASASSHLLADGLIFRFNRLFRNWGSPLQMRPWRETLHFRHARMYHNVFDHNNHEAFRVL